MFGKQTDVTSKGAEWQELTLVVGAELDSDQQFLSILLHSAPLWTLSLMVIVNTFNKCILILNSIY